MRIVDGDAYTEACSVLRAAMPPSDSAVGGLGDFEDDMFGFDSRVGQGSCCRGQAVGVGELERGGG